MVPMALGLGDGGEQAEVRQRLGILIIRPISSSARGDLNPL
jgi:hypothetical protein